MGEGRAAAGSGAATWPSGLRAARALRSIPRLAPLSHTRDPHLRPCPAWVGWGSRTGRRRRADTWTEGASALPPLPPPRPAAAIQLKARAACQVVWPRVCSWHDFRSETCAFRLSEFSLETFCSGRALLGCCGCAQVARCSGGESVRGLVLRGARDWIHRLLIFQMCQSSHLHPGRAARFGRQLLEKPFAEK